MHFTDPKVLIGMNVIGRGDVTLGLVEDVYADIRSGHPQWVAIRTGLFGADVSLVPLTGAEPNARRLRVPYGTSEIAKAPHRVPGIVMGHKEEANLFRYYGTLGRLASGHTHNTGRTMLHKFAVRGAHRRIPVRA